MDALRRRAARALTVSLTVAVGLSGAAALTAVPATAVDAPPAKPLTLVAAATTVTANRYEGVYTDLSDLGVYLVANGGAAEFRSGRDRYDQPVTTTLTTGDAGHRTTQTLPAGLSTSVNVLAGMVQVRLVDAKGKVAFKQVVDFCPSYTSRTRPDAPATSPYPEYCGYHPFAVGGLFGIQDGWAASLTSGGYGVYGNVKPGTYSAEVRVVKAYRLALGLSAAESFKTVTVKVVDVKDDEGGFFYGPMGSSAKLKARSTGKALRPAASAPTVAAAPADPSLAPDLRSLPAWGISTSMEKVAGQKKKHTFVNFGATVWNAGPSPLVVDGFRSTEDLMNAYQYFFDADGKQIGSTPAGTMEWDPRKGHQHWHFTDFAVYELVSKDQSLVVKSGKEAFCLAPTDPIDLRVKAADWNPYSTGLDTACGTHGALAVREALNVGWGDTYTQDRPGQSFDISKVPAGIYYIRVTANPEGKLVETSTTNNVSLRTVSIGGKPGFKRTLKVYPKQGIAD